MQTRVFSNSLEIADIGVGVLHKVKLCVSLQSKQGRRSIQCW